jgi:cytochrome c oxidase cbb3-type subunit I
MKSIFKISGILMGLGLSTPPIQAQTASNIIENPNGVIGFSILLGLLFVPLIIFVGSLMAQFFKLQTQHSVWLRQGWQMRLGQYLHHLDKNQVQQLLQLKKNNKKCKCVNCKKPNGCSILKTFTLIFLSLLASSNLSAQSAADLKAPLSTQPGILITIGLLLIPILLGSIFALVQANRALRIYIRQQRLEDAKLLARQIQETDAAALQARIPPHEELEHYNPALSSRETAWDKKGVIHSGNEAVSAHFTATKKKADKRPTLAPDITKLILWYLGCATFWLVVGTGIGEYLGIKFIVPEADTISWLSFGRLRPVHTNIVFWGWASLGMIGLGYYVVPTVSNTKIYSIQWGWIALILTNLMVICGSICLMAGMNNGGGEFREYIWPVMALFAVALILTLANFWLTVARRTTPEIYISNWYIVSAIIFTIIVALTAYLPFWQDGVSETIVQGYFMHSGVGMWFTLYTLGLMYYFIPQQINKPIYAYGLGILAFWTQILFYTVIGTHHFVFAPIPWWLQTVGIVGSAGMIIPVVAATVNFMMTFKGQWHKVSNSYTLPFFFVAVVYYFVVSLQGTAEAFKFTNLLWHFTDFTVAHAHLGFYGIISFAIWGGAYAIVPRLTSKEPTQYLVGAHFWLAFVGILFYALPLSYGATLRGLMWMEGKPFIDSVVVMFDYWLWRAIGGSLMFLSHLVFAYNFYQMTNWLPNEVEVDVQTEALNFLKQPVK